MPARQIGVAAYQTASGQPGTDTTSPKNNIEDYDHPAGYKLTVRHKPARCASSHMDNRMFRHKDLA